MRRRVTFTLSAEAPYSASLMTLNSTFGPPKGSLRSVLPHVWDIQTSASIDAGLRFCGLLSSVEEWFDSMFRLRPNKRMKSFASLTRTSTPLRGAEAAYSKR